MKLVKLLKEKIESALPLVLVKFLFSRKWLLLLGAVVWGNAIAVAYYTHQVRTRTAELEQLEFDQYQLEMEWETLRLEQGTLAEHSRIEDYARRKLKMKSVAASDEVLMKQ